MRNTLYLLAVLILALVGYWSYSEMNKFDDTAAFSTLRSSGSYQEMVLLGFSTSTKSYIILGIKESGMKSVLGEIMIVEKVGAHKLVDFNGSVDELKKTFSIDKTGNIFYTEFQSFGGNDFNSENVSWQYDTKTREYKLLK